MGLVIAMELVRVTLAFGDQIADVKAVLVAQNVVVLEHVIAVSISCLVL
jgi:hypothetical protein